MIRHRVASFWTRPAKSKSLKGEIASGTVCCPCGLETRVLLYKAQTQRRATSPDLIAYEAWPRREGPTEGVQ